MSALSGPIWLVGCGKMGTALAEGWLDAGLAPEALVVVEKVVAARDAWSARGALTLEGPAGLDRAPEPAAVVFAVKPQQMSAVLEEMAPVVPKGAVAVSIAAGTPLALFERALGRDRAIVRAMPNTPAAVGRGATALVANAASDARARELATALMAAVGATVWLDGEDEMHAVTALSGSGPAYVFLLIEAMTAAGVRLGLAPELAATLAGATVSGAGELARASTLEAAELRRNVTSPAGTTAAALEVLMADDGLEALMVRAMAAAARRSEELGRPEAGA